MMYSLLRSFALEAVSKFTHEGAQQFLRNYATPIRPKSGGFQQARRSLSWGMPETAKAATIRMAERAEFEGRLII